ncbi:MAG: 30S ribosomal protein S12 methylthiotransferase RimO [Candidatus Krumholzibacteriota bacterium]|nr:30S ribosomal protein S12 methylthiotransferase RimO [Candidatus Krumholzibacteriota bacterium]
MTGTRRLYLETLGCSKNLVDSEALLNLLPDGRFVPVADPLSADLIVLNTCGFIEAAREENVERLLALVAVKRETGARLAVIGCLSQRYARTLAEEVPEIDLLAGVCQQAELAGALTELGAAAGAPRSLVPASPRISFAGCLGRPLLTPPHLAYVKVSEGCSRACAFCAIPAIRGPYRSRTPADIEAEVRELAERGVGEINLISQDTAAYGRDSGEDLPGLVRRLARVAGPHWLRLFYLHPALVDLPGLLDIFAQPRVAPYLDLPIQHASDPVLARMRRGHDRARLAALLGGLRRERPDLCLRTTVMVGHPGETAVDFAALLDFLAEHPFDKLGAFVFSAEEGTPAAAMPDAVPAELAAERLERLQLQQMEISAERHAALVGRVLGCFVEALAGVGDGLPPGRGVDPLADGPFPNARAALRTERDAYEVDGHLFLDDAGELSLGQYVEAEVLAADVYDLRGRLANTPDRH